MSKTINNTCVIMPVFVIVIIGLLLSSSYSSTSICPNGWRLPTGGGAYASDSISGVNITGSPNTYSDFYNLGYSIMGSVAYESIAQENAYYDNNTINAAGYTASEAFFKYPNNFITSGIFLFLPTLRQLEIITQVHLAIVGSLMDEVSAVSFPVYKLISQNEYLKTK